MSGMQGTERRGADRETVQGRLLPAKALCTLAHCTLGVGVGKIPDYRQAVSHLLEDRAWE